MEGLRMMRIAVAALALVLTIGHGAYAAERLKVVASFSILGDFVAAVGGEHVSVVTLVGPDGDAHAYVPTPAHVQDVAEAGAIIVNGLGLEGWLGRLLEASGTPAKVSEATKGITPIAWDEEEHDEHHDEAHGPGAFDPHAFQSISNALVYVKNIAEALCTADRDNCAAFQANAAHYSKQLKGLDAEVRASLGRIPADKRRVITAHDAFNYFAHDYGIEFLAPEGVSTDAEASAADVAKLIRQIREKKAAALFVENITDPRLIEQIASETGLKVSGVLFSDALSAKDGPAASYIDMMRHNVRTILEAIAQAS
jgi:zinc/manganese transport system substrate-binding protein